MNDLYLHQLETENKQLRIALQECRKALVEEITTKNKAIDYINNNCVISDEWTDLGFCNFIPTGKITYKQLTSKKVKELLKILGGINESS